jgi:CHASE3 domain sensor protein
MVMDKLLPHNLSVRHLLILGMLVPTLLLLLVGVLQWKSGNDFRISRQRVTHTRTVLLDLESLLTCVIDAETGQRGYLLVHNGSYLEPYNHSLAFSHDQIQTLQQLIWDPEQQKNLDRLKPLMKAKFDELAQTITLEQRGDHAAALQVIANNSGKNTMDEIRTTVRAMQEGETSLFEQQEDAYQRSSKINSELSTLLLTLGLSCIVAIFFFFLLRRYEQMQEIIKICAWSKLIEYEGEWVSVEEYLSRRLHARVTHGISRVEAEKMLKLLEKGKLKKAA